MRLAMVSIYIVALVTAFLAPSPEKKLPPVKQVDFSGYYSCVGVQGGKEYRAIVMVDKVPNKDVHIVAWSLRGVSFTGIGFIKGEHFICGWSGSTMRGVGIYTFSDKTLTGEILSLPGDGTTYRETWKFLRPLEKADE